MEYEITCLDCIYYQIGHSQEVWCYMFELSTAIDKVKKLESELNKWA
jgi:hypothetical protein